MSGIRHNFMCSNDRSFCRLLILQVRTIGPVWMQTPGEQAGMPGHNYTPRAGSASFSPDGRTIVIGTKHYLEIWNADTGAQVTIQGGCLRIELEKTPGIWHRCVDESSEYDVHAHNVPTCVGAHLVNAKIPCR